MKDYKVDVEQLLYSYYIKYDKLKELTLNNFSNTPYANATEIDVYVDVYDMLTMLYKYNTCSKVRLPIASSVINLAAHIREYYWSRHHVNTNIFLVNASGTSMSHRQYYMSFGQEDFKLKFNYAQTYTEIENQLKLVQILSAYIYGVYYVVRECDFAVFAYNNILKYSNGRPSILYTKSEYAYQVPALLNNCFIFRPKKHGGDDTSYCVSNQTVLSSLYKIGDKSAYKLNALNPLLLSLIMTLNGLPSKKVDCVISITSAIKMIYDAVSTNQIINGYNTDISYVYSKLNIANRIDFTNFSNRFYALDLVYQNKLYESTAESVDNKHIINLNDKDSIQKINNTYFIDNPLDLNSL